MNLQLLECSERAEESPLSWGGGSVCADTRHGINHRPFGSDCWRKGLHQQGVFCPGSQGEITPCHLLPPPTPPPPHRLADFLSVTIRQCPFELRLLFVITEAARAEGRVLPGVHSNCQADNQGAAAAHMLFSDWS